MTAPLSPRALQRQRRFEVEARHKLADRAEKMGVRIVQEFRSGEQFAVDRRKPVAYRVSTTDCSCKEFRFWGRCPHWALLLRELGMIPDLDEAPWPDEVPAFAEMEAIGAD